jgi:hypothetical protein
MSTNSIRKVKTSDLELKDRLVGIQRVTKVTKGGRTFSFSAIVVVGNEDGIVGHGLGKAKEVTTAIAKGVECWCKGCTGEIQGFIQSAQPGEGYFPGTARTEGCPYCGTASRGYNGQSI